MDDYPSLAQRLWGWAESGFYVLIALMLVLGTLFLGLAFWNAFQPAPTNVDAAAVGLARLENVFGGDSSLQFAIGFYAGAIALSLIVGLIAVCRRLDAQTRTLQSLSERRRANSTERVQP